MHIQNAFTHEKESDFSASEAANDRSLHLLLTAVQESDKDSDGTHTRI